MQEIWKDIKGYEGLYQVSNLGNVKSLKTNKNLYSSNAKGYRRVGLFKGKRKGYSIHRLVAQAFIPNPENKPCVNHKDCNRANNNVNNLEWCTHKENNNYKTHKLRTRISMLQYLIKTEYSDCKKLNELIKEIKEEAKKI